jgi:hypothetical protein
MNARRIAVLAAIAALAGVSAGRPSADADPPSLTGRWTLNRALSRIPGDIGFGMDLLPGQAPDPGARSDIAGETAAAMALYRESVDDATRRDHLVEEVRRPPEELAITQTDEAVIVAMDNGRPRSFRPDGREAIQMLGRVPVVSVARWNGPRFEVRYKVQQNREVRYEYSRAAEPLRLVVQVSFVERGGKDTATLIYEAAREADPAAPRPASPPSPKPQAPPDPARPPVFPPPGGLGGLGQAGRPGSLPPPSQPAAPTPPTPQDAPGPIGPDAPLAGLARIGMVVEELRPQAATCGLSQAPLEALVTKAFTDAGLKVLRDSDEDTYVYVDINTSSLSTGLCVSRYDVYLFTHTMARLSHQSSPVLVQVQLLHQGGMAGGAAATHGDAVRRNVTQAVESFASRIRAASAR